MELSMRFMWRKSLYGGCWHFRPDPLKSQKRVKVREDGPVNRIDYITVMSKTTHSIFSDYGKRLGIIHRRDEQWHVDHVSAHTALYSDGGDEDRRFCLWNWLETTTHSPVHVDIPVVWSLSDYKDHRIWVLQHEHCQATKYASIKFRKHDGWIGMGCAVALADIQPIIPVPLVPDVKKFTYNTFTQPFTGWPKSPEPYHKIKSGEAIMSYLDLTYG